jgi:hypothetical protein
MRLALLLFIAFVTGNHAFAQTAGAAQPVDLTGRFNFPLSVTTNYNFLAWKTIPAGHQVFHGIPFEINGEIRLWGTGRSTNNFSPNPERAADIPVNRQFETLYVYHCAHFKMPDGTPVCKIVFRYDNGSSATNSLCFGDDMLDWLVSGNEAPMHTPSGADSTIAWVGGQYSDTQKNQLRFCMTAIKNPHPTQTVSTIDLISCKTKVVPIIMAMTTGPAGLMK